MTIGGPVVTVGVYRSGADYTDVNNNETAFNTAVTDMAAAGGGTIKVWRGTYTAQSEFILSGNNIRVEFEGGALLRIQNFPPFPYLGKIARDQPTADATIIFAIANAQNIEIHGLHVNNEFVTGPPNPPKISGILIAGLVKNCRIYDSYVTNVVRYARYHTAYLLTSKNVEYDGHSEGVQWYASRSDGCGSNVSGVRDGGGSKYSNGASVSTVETVTEFGPVDSGCNFSAFDSNPQNNDNGQPIRNIERFGGYGKFTTGLPNALEGVFLEAGFARGNESIRLWGGKYDGQVISPNTNIGLLVGASNSSVHAVGLELANFSTGVLLVGLPQVPEVGGNTVLNSILVRRCATGVQLGDTTNNPGMISTSLRIRDLVVDDEGAGVTVTGLDTSRLSVPGPELVDLKMTGADFSRVSAVAGSSPVLYGAASGLNFPETTWKDLRGVTDQGVVSLPLGANLTYEIRSGGSTATPDLSVKYKINVSGVSITTSGGTSPHVSVFHPDGTPLGTLSTGGSPGTTVSSARWYQIQSAMVLSSSGGDSSIAIFAIGPDGTVYVNGAHDSSNQPSGSFPSLPAGTLITWGIFSGGPTVTLQGGGVLVWDILQNKMNITSLAAPLLWGSAVNFGSSPPPTISVQRAGSTIVSPFFKFYELGPMGATATFASGPATYEVRGVPLVAAIAGGSSVQVFDQQNRAIATLGTSLAVYRLEVGFRLAYTLAPTTFVVSLAPA